MHHTKLDKIVNNSSTDAVPIKPEISHLEIISPSGSSGLTRMEFLKTCGLACIGGSAIAIFLQSCAGQYYATSLVEGNNLKVATKEFTLDQNDKPVNRKYILVKSDRLNFPIYLYKQNENQYTALWMECTHQGAELSVHGEYLTCPSHGSEFDKTGKVMNGPASSNLRSFKTNTDNQYIYIQLS